MSPRPALLFSPVVSEMIVNMDSSSIIIFPDLYVRLLCFVSVPFASVGPSGVSVRPSETVEARDV
jgi:hypothetical protein